MNSWEDKAEKIRLEFEAARDKLYREDGNPRYAEEEHQERLAELQAQRNAALDAIEEDAQSALDTARKDLLAIENGDVTRLLAENDIQKASIRQPLISSDVAMLDREQLLQRLSAVAASSDDASKFCYWLAARDRLGNSSGGTTDVELAEAVSGLRESLTPGHLRSKIENARSRIDEAGQARDAVTKVRRGRSVSSSGYMPRYSVPRR